MTPRLLQREFGLCNTCRKFLPFDVVSAVPLFKGIDLGLKLLHSRIALADISLKRTRMSLVLSAFHLINDDINQQTKAADGGTGREDFDQSRTRAAEIDAQFLRKAQHYSGRLISISVIVVGSPTVTATSATPAATRLFAGSKRLAFTFAWLGVPSAFGPPTCAWTSFGSPAS